MSLRDDLLSTRPELLRAFREGRRDAMKAVFDAYEPLVRTIACRGFAGFPGYRSPHEVDDAVASTFAAAFEPQARLRYDGISPYHAWLSGVARNTIRSLCRKSGREIPLAVDEESASFRDTEAATPEEDAIRRDDHRLSERFRAFLADPNLEQVCHRVLALGESEQAAADELRMTRHQVRKALARIRKKIQLFLREEGLA